MHDIMLDLETLGTGPNAAVIAIGACFFDIQTRQIGATFYRTLKLEDVVRGGGEMDASTVLWWLAQSDDARRAIYAEQEGNARTPIHALTEFTHFVTDNSTEPPRMWGNGSNFDNVILASMYQRHGMELPWKFWNDRCYRTVKAMHRDGQIFLERNDIKHHALSDAMHQARTLINLLNPDSGPARQLGAELDEDDPLWLVDAQIGGLLEGIGASEDHENVIQFLLETGLPRSTVDRIHKAIVWGDTKVQPPTFDLVAHLRRQMVFSMDTFGPGLHTAGVLDHIRKELTEIEQSPNDLSEWADLILLALDGAWRRGFGAEEVANAIASKQAINEARKWPDWRTADHTKAIEHIQEAVAQ